MATAVADIVHPAAYIEQHVEIGNVVYQATRVFSVTGLSADGPANTLQSRAQRTAGIPKVGDAHPDSVPASFGCVVRGIRTQPIPQSDDACYVYVDYWTVIPQFQGGVGIISIERDTNLSFETGDRHYGSGQQILINPPRNKGGTKTLAGSPVPGSRSFGLPLRRMIIRAAVVPQNLASIEVQVGTVNGDSTWFGLQRGYWRFDSFRDVYQLGTGNIVVEAEFLTRNTRNWHTFTVRTSEINGEIIAVNTQDMTAAMQASYVYGIQQFPGITVVGDYPAVTFGPGGLFGISKNPFLP